ncbi:hypothetical protein ACVW0K_005992 [Streptomyces filamentosus]
MTPTAGPAQDVRRATPGTRPAGPAPAHPAEPDRTDDPTSGKAHTA